MNRGRKRTSYTFSAKPGKRCNCQNTIRPCPFVFCRYNLFSNIRTSGFIDFTFSESEYSCVLDVIEENGSLSLEEVGRLLNITRTRVQLIEEQALRKLANQPGVEALAELVGLRP
jgi:hypothetical protein